MSDDEIHHATLQENLNNLIAFKKVHGHWDVPNSHPNCSLHEFVRRCRTRRKHTEPRTRLSSYLIRKLDELGFCWNNSKDAAFDKRLEELQAFYDQHGHCIIPHNGRTKAHKQLYNWLQNQINSEREGRLAKERKERMDAIGEIPWFGRLHQAFDKRIVELQEFQNQHGHCIVPCCTRHLQLYSWLFGQRRREREGKLPKERKAKLDAIGKIPWFEKDHHDAVFDDHLDELQAFYKLHGHCLVPKTTHKVLYQWLLRRRHREREGKLPKEQKAKLDAIGKIPWFPKEHEEEEGGSTEDNSSDDNKDQDGDASNADNCHDGQYTHDEEEHQENNFSRDKKSHVLRSKALASSCRTSRASTPKSHITGPDCRLWNRNDEKESESEYTSEEDEEQERPTRHNPAREARSKGKPSNNPPRSKTSKAQMIAEKPQDALEEVDEQEMNTHGICRRSPNLGMYYDQVHPVEESQRTLEEVDMSASSNERGMKNQSTSRRRLQNNLSTYYDQVHSPPCVARKRQRSNVPTAAADETKSSLKVNGTTDNNKQQASSEDTLNQSDKEEDTEIGTQQSNVVSRGRIEASATRKHAASAPKGGRDLSSDKNEASEEGQRASSSSNGETNADRKYSRGRSEAAATRKLSVSLSSAEPQKDREHPLRRSKKSNDSSSKKVNKKETADAASLLLLPLVDSLIRQNDALRIDLCSGFVAIVYAQVMMQEGRPSNINEMLNWGVGSTRLLFLTNKLLNLLETIPDDRSLRVARRCSVFLKGRYHHTRKAKVGDPALKMIYLVDQMIVQVVSSDTLCRCITTFENLLLHAINPPPPGIRYCLPPSNYMPEWKLMCLAMEICDVAEASSGDGDFSDLLKFCKSKLKKELKMHVKAQQEAAGAAVVISDSESSEHGSPPAAKRARHT